MWKKKIQVNSLLICEVKYSFCAVHLKTSWEELDSVHANGRAHLLLHAKNGDFACKVTQWSTQSYTLTCSSTRSPTKAWSSAVIGFLKLDDTLNVGSDQMQHICWLFRTERKSTYGKPAFTATLQALHTMDSLNTRLLCVLWSWENTPGARGCVVPSLTVTALKCFGIKVTQKGRFWGYNVSLCHLSTSICDWWM